MMSNSSRRRFSLLALATAPLALAGCGGGLFSSTSTPESDAARGSTAAGGSATETVAPVGDSPNSPSAPAWNIQEVLAFVAGTPSTIDLNNTLPQGVASGGTFGVASSGAPLPSTVTLASSGVLTVAATAAIGATTGVVFTYSAPQ
jgi:hypothetical protein